MNWKRILAISAVVLVALVVAFGAWRMFGANRLTRAARVVTLQQGQSGEFHFDRGEAQGRRDGPQFHGPVGLAGRGSAFSLRAYPMPMARPGNVSNSVVTGVLVLAGVGLGWYLGRSSWTPAEIEVAESKKKSK
jgi:hypothetical protein